MNLLPVPADLWVLLRDLRVVSPTAVVAPGEAPTDGRALPSVGTHPRPRDPLTAAAQAVVYRRCYIRAPTSATIAAPAELASALAAANHGRDGWSTRWGVERVNADGSIVARKGDTRVDAASGAYQTYPLGQHLSVGREVALRVSRGSLTAQPGYYFVFGEQLADRDDASMTARLYFNVPAHEAAALVDHVSRRLNAYLTPFRFKCPITSSGYARSDAAVLYLARRQLASAWLVLTEEPGVLTRLRPSAPMWSRRLAPGIGAADDPGGGESFGMQRARLVAEGMVAAHHAGVEDPGGRLEAIHETFQARGLDPARPHLNPGMSDFDELPRARWGADEQEMWR